MKIAGVYVCDGCKTGEDLAKSAKYFLDSANAKEINDNELKKGLRASVKSLKNAQIWEFGAEKDPEHVPEWTTKQRLYKSGSVSSSAKSSKD